MTNNKQAMTNNNIKMVYFFESPFNSKLNNADKGKTPLDILKNYDEFLRPNSFSLRLNRNLRALQIYNNELNNYNKKHHPVKLITSLNKPLNNIVENITKNISITRKREIIIQENKNRLINNVKYIDPILKKSIPLPINLIGTQPLNQKNRNYLKLITTFNTEVAKFKNNIFSFNLNNNKLIKNIYSILEYSFKSMSSLISKPSFSITPDKIVIHLFFFLISDSENKSLKLGKFIKSKYNKNNKFSRKLEEETFLQQNHTKLESLCSLLSKIFNKPVELDLVRLYYPFYEPNILVNAFGLIADTIKLRFILKRLLKVAIIKNPTRMLNKKRFSLLPCYLSGMDLKFAGRLMTQRVVPRKTVKSLHKGTLARRKATLVENARFTNKNKRGSFSVSVSIGYFM